MGVSAAIGAGVLIAGYSVDQSKKQTRAQEGLVDQQNRAQIKLQSDLKDRQTNEQNSQSSKALRAAVTGGTYNTTAGTKGGTVLTSPLGIAPQTGSGNKTLLGQ